MKNKFFKYYALAIGLCTWLILMSFSQTWSQVLVINEFLAANDTTLADEDGDFSDWIELYNPTATAANLANFSLTDDFSRPRKWIFPSVTMEPGQFLLVWASDKNRQVPGQLHSNFKLDKSGEEIALFDPSGMVVDSVSFGPQKTDVSTGRLPDGGPWSQFLTPTPLFANRAMLSAPNFSHESGFYSAQLTLHLTASDPNTTIRYTLDGAEVTAASPAVTGPMTLAQTTVLRAATFASTGARSPIVTKSYFLNETVSMPILSLVTDPKNLWDPASGIYVNYDERGDEWERPGQATFFETSGLAFDLPAGLRIHGYVSRAYPKKSLRLYFRSDYGASRLHYPLFPTHPVQEFDRLVVHASGEDQLFYPGRWTLIKNALITVLSEKSHSIVTASRPTLLYLNGEFWGVYHIRERIDDFFIESHFDFEQMDLLKGNTTVELDVEEGNLDHWRQTYDFFESHDLSNTQNYARACQLIDINNFTDHMIIGAYSGDHDWPHNNFYLVRALNGDDRWRWIAWDSDHAFANHYKEDVTLNSIDWITRAQPRPDLKLFGSEDREKYLWATLMLRRLLENKDYRTFFINRFSDLLNTILHPQMVRHQVDSLAALIAPKVDDELARWGNQAHESALVNWQENIDSLRSYVQRRPEILRDYLEQYFQLGDMALLTIGTPEGEGTVQVNTITPGAFPWQGQYFQNLVLSLKALPGPGYRFWRWSDSRQPAQDSIRLALTADYVIHPVFISTAQPQIVVEPNPYDFGPVGLNNSATVVLNARNDGSAMLAVSRVLLAGANASEFHLQIQDTSFSLQLGQSRMLEVRFQPVSSGNKAAVLQLESNDLNQPVYQVRLTGKCYNIKPKPKFDLAVDEIGADPTQSEAELQSQDASIQPTATAAVTIAFVDITNSSHTAGYSSSGYGHGVSFADVNRDGKIDLFASNAIRDQILPDHLFINQGNNVFDDQAPERGTENWGLTHAIVSADIDNDGDLDVFFANMPENDTSPIGRNVLYRNDGSGNFTDISDWAGISNQNNGTRGAIALDIDNDGDLDLYAVNWGEKNEMYVNDGTGKMTRQDRGADGPEENPAEFGQQGVTAADVDNDGDIDIYVCRRKEGTVAAPNWLFINDGTGHFTEQAAARGVAVGGRTNGATFADVDRDGDLDLFVVNYAYTSGDLPILGVFFNRGDGTFEDRSADYNIYVSAYAVLFADVDNDADLDMLLLRNDQKESGARPELYLNDGNGHFTRQANTGVEVAVKDVRGAGCADIDGDGGLDFYLAGAKSTNFMLRNDTQTNNHYLEVLCTGPGGDYGGFGTSVLVYQPGHLGDLAYLLGMQQSVSNYGYLCQDQTALHFGLGEFTTCDLRIIRTDGMVLDYTNVAADQVFVPGQLFEISGAVNYYSNTAPVPQTIIRLSAASGARADTTDTQGRYLFANTTTGQVSLQPAKSNDVGDAISGSDALLILQYLAFLVELSPDQYFAADVTEDDEVTGSDAQAVLRYLAFFNDHIASTAQWRFDPADTVFTLSADAQVNFKGFILGDVTGDWSTGAMISQAAKPVAPFASILTLSVGHTTAENQLQVMIRADGFKEPIHTLLLSLDYDPSRLEYLGGQADASCNDFMTVINGTEPGKVHVAMAGVNGIQLPGPFLQLDFGLKSEPSESGPMEIRFTRALANDQACRFENLVIAPVMPADNAVPTEFKLSQNYPNPFSLKNARTQTVISYQLPQPVEVVLSIFNIEGRLIRRLGLGQRAVGKHHLTWDGTDDQGQKVASGLYFYQMVAGAFTAQRKLLVIR